MPDPRLLEAYLRMTKEEALRRQREQREQWIAEEKQRYADKRGEATGLGDLMFLRNPMASVGLDLAERIGDVVDAPGAQLPDTAQSGLVLSKRNLPALRKTYTTQLERLNRERPRGGTANVMEAAYAAKYPKLYERATQTNPISVMYTGSGRGGSYYPTGKSGIQIYDSRAYPTPPGQLADSIGHEIQHAADFSRLPSGLRSPSMPPGEKIDLGHWTPAGSPPSTLEELRKAWEKLPSSARPAAREKMAEIKHSQPSYKSISSAGREGYEKQPVEARAFQAGRTASKKLNDFFEAIRREKELEFLAGGQ